MEQVQAPLTGFSTRCPGFDLKVTHFGFMLEKSNLRQHFSKYFGFIFVSIEPTLHIRLFVCHPEGGQLAE